MMTFLKIFLTATALSIVPIVQAAPLIRIFDLTTDITQHERLNTVGLDNLSNSIQNESGTLAMYVTHKKDKPDENIILEIYRDQKSYEQHASSPHFQRYVEMAKEVVKGKKVFETEPQFLAEKPSALTAVKDKNLVVNFVEVEIKPSSNTSFFNIVTKEMQQTMKNESDVLVMYAVTLKNQPNHWCFFEVYANKNTYQQHREKAYFKDYINKTKNMVRNKTFMQLDGDILMSKGGLMFVRY